MREFSFFVEGVARPKGSMQAFAKGGKINMVHASNKLKGWQTEIEHAARDAIGDHEKMEGAVQVIATFFMKKGKSVKRDRPYVAPDLDKLLRTLCDALQNTIIFNDCQICSFYALKVYAGGQSTPGVRVRVISMEDE
jgi:crossover junction endodeoxyribonuclease RusA